jgi:hypothetical protein
MTTPKIDFTRIEQIEGHVAAKLTAAHALKTTIAPADLAQLAQAEAYCAQGREALEHVQESAVRKRRGRDQRHVWRKMREILDKAMPAIEAVLEKMIPKPVSAPQAVEPLVLVTAKNLKQGHIIVSNGEQFMIKHAIKDDREVVVWFDDPQSTSAKFDLDFAVFVLQPKEVTPA